MSFVLENHHPVSEVILEGDKIGRRSRCHYCGKTIGDYCPVVIFELQQPAVIGAAHPECGFFDFRYAQFSLSEQLQLSPSETSFLAHFYPRLVKLPGQGHLRSLLRRSLASLLMCYPDGMKRLPVLLNCFKEENQIDLATYPGDLETDFCLFLGETRQAARIDPVNVLIDFT